MFTKNFKNIVSALCMEKLGFVESAEYAGKKLVSPFSPSIATKLLTSDASYAVDDMMKRLAKFTSLSENIDKSYYGIVLGTGTTEATEDDIDMAGDLVSEKVFTSDNTTYTFSYIKDDDGEIYGCQNILVLSNTSQSDVTIGEVGLASYVYGIKTEDDKSYWYFPVLLERTVLDQPITIPSGGVGKITYTLSLEGAFI